MISLNKSLAAWGQPDFPDTLKQEILALDTNELPLQEALSAGNYALDEGFDVTVMNSTDDPDYVHAKAGIFYTGVDAGCSCDADPTIACHEPQYCEVRIDIDKADGNATISLIAD